MCRKFVFPVCFVLLVALAGNAWPFEKASNPNPPDGAGCVDPDVVLDWYPWPGPPPYEYAYAVYLGTDFDDVNNATETSPEYKGLQVSNIYNPGGLAPNMTYYWRIDEVNDAHPESPWKGDVWSFTTTCHNCVQPPAGMVAWWPLDEDDTPGGISHDIVNYNNGTWRGSPTPVTGMVAGALSFNGTSDYVEVPDAVSLNFSTRDFSIDAWIRTNSTDTYEVFVDKRDHDTVIGYEFLLYNGKLTFELVDSGGWTNYYNPASSDLRDGQWHHVAVTVDRDNSNGGRLYVGGELIHTFNPTGRTGDITNPADLWIGRHHPVSIYPHELWFDGEIDEVELFSRALDANEIIAIFNADSAGKCKDCNHNGIPDWLDIFNGTSEDCQPDGIPDECQECEQAGSICKCGSVQGIPRNGSDSDYIWSRTLSTKRFRARKVGDISGPAEWSFTWEAMPDVASYPAGKTQFGIYPTSGFWKQHRCKQRGNCNKKPQRYCCDDSCDETNPEGSCRWSNERCILFEDKAVGGNFCNPVDVDIVISDVDRPWWPIIEAFTNKVVDTVGCFFNWNDPETKACRQLLKDKQALRAAMNDWTGYTFHIGAYNDSLSSPPAEGTYVGPPDDGTCTHKDFQLYPDSWIDWPDWPARIETEWRLIRLGQGNEIGNNYCLNADTDNGTCDITYFAYGQISGTELKFMTRLSEDLSDPTLYNGVRKFNFCVDVDNDPTTGCPEWPICCDCRIQIRIESDGEKFIGEPELTIWCWGCHPTICDPLVWVLQDGIPYDFYLDEHVLEITVKLADIKNPQAAMSAWVVHESPSPAVGICTLPSPLDCSEPGLEIAITTDNVCPWVAEVDAFDVLDGHLDMPIYVTFSEPMAPIEQSDIVVDPPISVSLSLDSTERILSIDPITEFVPGRYTFTLMGSIIDASGNNLDGNMDFACGDPYVFELCIPDHNFVTTDSHGTPKQNFGLGEDIYISGHGFPPEASFYAYLVSNQTIEKENAPLLDQSNDGPNLAHADGNGNLFWNIGSALRHGHFVGVVNMNGDRMYQANIDRVVPTCEFIDTGPCYAPDDVVAWWPLDEAAGSDAADELVEKNIAWYYGDPTPVAGKVAYALDFDGVDDYLVADHNESLNFDINDFSIDAWVFLPGNSGTRSIADKMDSFYDVGYALSVSKSNVLTFEMGDGSTVKTFVSTGSVPVSQWAHVAVTVDRNIAAGGVFYINGQPAGIFNPTAIQGSIDSNEPLWIGRSHGPGQPYFHGNIDEINLFDSNLTHGQILFIYNAGADGKCQLPLAGDVTLDWYVGLDDLQIIADEWLSDIIPLRADLYQADGQHIVNFKDYVIFAVNWLEEGVWR